MARRVGLGGGRERLENAAVTAPFRGLPQADLDAPVDVPAELGFHHLAQPRVIGQDVDLVIREEAGDVEIARPDPDPAPVHHDRLGVEHRAAPFEDPHAGAQQLVVVDPGEPLDPGQVALARRQHPHNR